MKRLSLGAISCVLLLAGAMIAGCGEERHPVEPAEVINRAYADLSQVPAGDPPAAEVEVASLGYEDQSLRTRTLAVDPDVYAALRDAITGNTGEGTTGEGPSGLLGLADSVESEGSEELAGIEVDHVSGTFDVDSLISTLTRAIDSDSSLRAQTGLPRSGELEQLRETLTEATFDLFVSTEGRTFERLDLTLSLDDRENALPATRIRFSLTEVEPPEENQ